MKNILGIEVFLKLRPFSHIGNLGKSKEIGTLCEATKIVKSHWDCCDFHKGKQPLCELCKC